MQWQIKKKKNLSFYKAYLHVATHAMKTSILCHCNDMFLILCYNIPVQWSFLSFNIFLWNRMLSYKKLVIYKISWQTRKQQDEYEKTNYLVSQPSFGAVVKTDFKK